MTSVLRREKKSVWGGDLRHRETQGEKPEAETGINASIDQVTSGVTRVGRSSLRTFRECMALPTTWFQASAL